jgi:type VII secretion protein EccB
MWTPRDQLQAYQFLRRRLVSALQTGDANHPVSPSRRLVVGYAVGLVFALVAVAGFGIYGVLRPGASQKWRATGQVVIEKETGATYVLMADGLLHPVLNYASARLLAGGDGRATATVSTRSLAGVARGLPVGITGAPDSLPARNRLVTGPWTVCSGTTGDRPAEAPPETTAMIGVPAAGQPIGPRETLLVRDASGTRFAVVEGRRWRLRDTATAVALGYDNVVSVPVTASWLSAVPAGPDLALITVPNAGDPGPQVGAVSTLVGQVLVVQSVGSEDRYYAVRPDALDAITETQAALILGNRANSDAYPGGAARPIPVSAADVASRSPGDRSAEYPARKPGPVQPPTGALACAALNGNDGDGNDRVTASLAGTVPLPAGARAVPAGGDARTADSVYVPPASGALVRDQQSQAATLGTTYLITDQGTRYPLSGGAAQALGYGGVTPAPVASTVLALFPAGAVLDVTSAQRVVPR